jgi:hypothetical protein
MATPNFAKFHNPRTTPFGRNVCGTERKKKERKKEKKNNHQNSGHFDPLQCLRAAHAFHLQYHLKSFMGNQKIFPLFQG